MAFLAEGAYSASIPDVYGAAETIHKTTRETARDIEGPTDAIEFSYPRDQAEESERISRTTL